MGVYLLVRAARATLLLAIALAAVLWVFVRALGGILATGATDPESGLVLALLNPGVLAKPTSAPGDVTQVASAAVARQRVSSAAPASAPKAASGPPLTVMAAR